MGAVFPVLLYYIAQISFGRKRTTGGMRFLSQKKSRILSCEAVWWRTDMYFESTRITVHNASNLTA